MKVIDSKGKLFGIINVFDLFVISVIVFTAFFILKWAMIADDPAWMKVKISHANCVGVMQMPSYIAELVKEGDETCDSGGIVMARIAKIISNDATPVITYVSKENDKVFFNNNEREITVIVDPAGA